MNQNAEWTKEDRGRAVEALREERSTEKLWDCVVAFQGYPFFTVTGLPFQYTLKIGKDGTFTRELIVDRRQESKSLAWSSVVLAFEKAKEMAGRIQRPKAIGDIRGISYVYCLLWRFGVIEVPEKIERKLRGE